MAIGDCVLVKITQYEDRTDDENDNNGNDKKDFELIFLWCLR